MPKIVNREEYRREILEKCFRIFSRRGFSSVTMREIASEIGVSTGTLYHYFPTKESVLEQLFTFVRESNVALFLSRISEEMSADDRLDTIAGFWLEHWDYYQDVMLLGLDFFRMAGPKESARVFTEFSDYYADAISEGIVVPREIARTVFIYLLGLVVHTLLTPELVSRDTHIGRVRDMLAVIMEGSSRGDPSIRNAIDYIFGGLLLKR